MDYVLQTEVGVSDCSVVAVCNLYKHFKVDPPVDKITKFLCYTPGIGSDRTRLPHYIHENFNVISSGCFHKYSTIVERKARRRFMYHLGNITTPIVLQTMSHSFFIRGLSIINMDNKVIRKKTKTALLRKILDNAEYTEFWVVK